MCKVATTSCNGKIRYIDLPDAPECRHFQGVILVASTPGHASLVTLLRRAWAPMRPRTSLEPTNILGLGFSGTSLEVTVCIMRFLCVIQYVICKFNEKLQHIFIRHVFPRKHTSLSRNGLSVELMTLLPPQYNVLSHMKRDIPTLFAIAASPFCHFSPHRARPLNI